MAIVHVIPYLGGSDVNLIARTVDRGPNTSSEGTCTSANYNICISFGTQDKAVVPIFIH